MLGLSEGLRLAEGRWLDEGDMLGLNEGLRLTEGDALGLNEGR